MNDNGPLIALIAFVIFSIFFGVMAYQRSSDLQGVDSTPSSTTTKQYEIEEAQKKILILEAEITSKEIEIGVKREEMRVQADRGILYQQLKEDYSQALQLRAALLKMAMGGKVVDFDLKGFKNEASLLAGSIAGEKRKTEGNIRKDENDARERSEKQVREANEKKDSVIQRMSEEKKTFDRDGKFMSKQKNFVQAELDELNRRLTALTQREVERATNIMEIDGKVVMADLVNNTIVIDRGSVHGVKEGFRFEVFSMRAGNLKVHKAYIEVRKVQPSLSECAITFHFVALPRDPLSAYVAPEPEYKFSPYQSRGKSGISAQPLSGQPKSVVMGMNERDPMVEGDFIANPFYSPENQYTFYIAGRKEIVRGVQKTAIAYQWPEIERIARMYGSKVVDKVEIGVDFVIAQKNPDDDDEFKKAVTMGIPVIYEWELFRFLDQR